MLNKIILDEDIGLKNNEPCKIINRFGARGIVVDNDKIAIFYKKNKNEYKLPGARRKRIS